MIGMDFVNVVRTKPIPILVRQWLFMIVMAKPAESGGFGHHDHERELGTAWQARAMGLCATGSISG